MSRLFQSAFIVSVLLPLVFGVSQDPDDAVSIHKELETIKQAQRDIQRELQVIKDILLGKRTLMDDVYVEVGAYPALGSANARVTIVEFSDFECPHCGAFARSTFGKVVDEYVTTGKVRYVFRNFPMEELHPLAKKAAEAAMCAADQGKYLQAHSFFFDNQPSLGEVIKLAGADAAAIGLDPNAAEACLKSGKYADPVKHDLMEGVELGIRGTPTFFLGYSDTEHPSRMKAEKSLVGAPPLRDFEAAIEALLRLPESRGKVFSK